MKTVQRPSGECAIKGFRADRAITIGELAERLRIRHHSAVELVDRLCKAGLATRSSDISDQRRVLLSLTGRAEERLAALSAIHMDELSRLGPSLKKILKIAETVKRADLSAHRSPVIED